MTIGSKKAPDVLHRAALFLEQEKQQRHASGGLGWAG